MENIPPLLSSAQQVLSQGFSRLNQSAAQIAGAFDSASASPTGTDPLLAGFSAEMQARGEVGAGVALLRTYQRTTDDLMEMSDPWPRSRYVDRYA